MTGQNVQVCLSCWNKHTKHKPYTTTDDAPLEPCFFCQGLTSSGVYFRTEGDENYIPTSPLGAMVMAAGLLMRDTAAATDPDTREKAIARWMDMVFQVDLNAVKDTKDGMVPIDAFKLAAAAGVIADLGHNIATALWSIILSNDDKLKPGETASPDATLIMGSAGVLAQQADEATAELFPGLIRPRRSPQPTPTDPQPQADTQGESEA